MTYGPFSPDAAGSEYPSADVVDTDFARMVASSINVIRTYTVPPRWLLDLAARRGLWVMVGIAWEQHVAFLDSRARRRAIEQRVRAGVAACAGHPAVLCFALGNEIPAAIVRWYGRRRIERFIHRLYRAAKQEDPEALFTYVNFPSTEYLELPFCDFVSFNVYLEEGEKLEAYFARLQNLAGDRPLVMAELGLDSRRNGADEQAAVLGSQLEIAYSSGCAGAVVFSWADEWHRGGYDIEDWDFGLVDRKRHPKPALAAVSAAFEDVPFSNEIDWPRVSVCVCTHNGAATLQECLEGVVALDYPNFEVIVVDDGSTDASAAIAEEFGVRLVSTLRRGLSAARNVALEAATGEIVAYTDDDARPDPQWLRYLAVTFMRTSHAGVGGPNIPPPTDGFVSACVARAPGAPVHVLLTDNEAEHIPGCDMAFRKEALESIGGFDPRFRTAGDDVDICWRLQEAGYSIGFHPAAMVWHHRRSSVRAYFRQQRGYGEAEALLERKWPEKYNQGGQMRWAGRIYEPSARALHERRRRRIFYGIWGTGHFQSLYERQAGRLATLPMTPEWYLLMTALAAAAAYDAVVEPLLPFRAVGVSVTTILVALCALALVVQSWRVAGSSLAGFTGRRRTRERHHVVVAFLTMVQPLARLSGRLRNGLTPWRRRGMGAPAFPWPRTHTRWQERWQSPTQPLRRLEEVLKDRGRVVVRGSGFDRWDIQLLAGSLAGARLRLAVEEHGAGKQLLRYRIWPTFPLGALLASALFGAGLGFAAERGAPFATVLFAVMLAGLLVGMLHEAGAAMSGTFAAIADADAQGGTDGTLTLLELAALDVPVADAQLALRSMGDA